MKQNKAMVDLNEDAVYKVCEGELVKVDKPGNGYGKQVITWQNGKPTHYEVSYTVK